MKSIQTHINERLKLNRDRVQKYEYFPETKNELQDIIKNLIKERGNDVDLNIIDTSKITDMSDLFDNNSLKGFCGNISQWNVSNVREMNSMFFNCKQFNCDLSHWDVSKVGDMGFMFAGCINFAGDGLKNWNVSNVFNMSNMFAYCKNLKCDLSNWNVSNVYNMEEMFTYSNFAGNIDKWKVKSCKYMKNMFRGTKLDIYSPAWYVKFLRRSR